MTSVKVFVPYGAVGLNCTEEAFEAGLAMKPDLFPVMPVPPVPVLTTWAPVTENVPIADDKA